MNVGNILSLHVVLLMLQVLWGCRQTSDSEPVAAWRVDTSAVLEIGTVEGDAVYQLYRVGGIAELADGGIAIANRGSSHVRVYDANGRFVRAMGRAGGGPGEFSGLQNLVVRGDTICAYDRLTGRLARFLSSGLYLGEVVLRPEATMMNPNFAGLLGDGTSVGWVQIPAGEMVEGFQRGSALLVRFAAGGTVDTLGHYAGIESIIQWKDFGDGAITSTMASWGFYRTFLAVAAGDRIYAGATDSAAIHMWDGAGAPLPGLRWHDLPLPLDDDAVGALVERETSELEPDKREAERKAMLGTPHPPTAPVFDRLVLAPSGDLWVRRFGQPGTADSEWLVFDKNGSLRARTRIPREREIRAVGRERIYALERDAYDVEYVRAYTLLRS